MKTPVVAAVLLCVCGYSTAIPVPPASAFTWTGGRHRPLVSGQFLSDDPNPFPLEFSEDYSLFEDIPQEQVFPEPGRYVMNGPYRYVSEGVYQSGVPFEAEWVAPVDTQLDEVQPEPQPDVEAQYKEMLKMVEALLKSVKQSYQRRPLDLQLEISKVSEEEQDVNQDDFPHVLSI